MYLHAVFLLRVLPASILDYMIREPDHDFLEVVVQRFSIIHAGKLHNYQTTLRENRLQHSKR